MAAALNARLCARPGEDEVGVAAAFLLLCLGRNAGAERTESPSMLEATLGVGGGELRCRIALHS